MSTFESVHQGPQVEARTNAAPVKPEAAPRVSLEAQVQAILDRKHTGLKAPKIEVHVALISHGTVKDAEDLTTELQNSDIFIPEMADGTPDYINDLNKLSEGTMTNTQLNRKMREHAKVHLRQLIKDRRGITVSDQRLEEIVDEISNSPFSMHGFVETLHKIVYKSGKKIGHVDLGPDHKLSKQSTESVSDLPTQLQIDLADRVPLSLLAAKARLVATNFAKVQGAREQFMLDGIAEDIADFYIKDAKLQKKDKVKVFLYLGGWHLGVPATLKEAGDKVTTRTVNAAKYFDGLYEASQRARFGEQLTHEDGKQIVLSMVFRHLYSAYPDKRKGIFVPIHRHGSEALVSRILADEFSANVDDIYADFKRLQTVHQAQQYIVSLINLREASLKRRVAEWTDKLKNFKEV